jgi:arylsulfatase A-like enzyme
MLPATPFGNELVLELAVRLIESESLGRDAAPDLLCVGLSSNDYAGHIFGPESAEVLDLTVRTDRQLASFFDHLDALVGLDRCLVALTSDHGVTSIPPIARELGLPGGRLDTRGITNGLEQTLKEGLGREAPAEPLIAGMNLPWLYTHPQFDALDSRLNGRLSQAALEYLRGVDGVATAFSASELAGPAPSPDDVDRYLAWRCHHPQRAGRFYVKVRPYWTPGDGNAAGHNAGFTSDRHVPIMLFGPGVQPGWRFTSADPMDIAVTLSALLGIEPPLDARGRVLHEAIDAQR